MYNKDKTVQKLLTDIETAIIKCELKDGMCISFHHHFRNGDYIINTVLETISKMGIKNLTIAPSSLIDIHNPIIEHIKNGVVRKIETSGIRGELADFISNGGLEEPVIFRSHGGRASAIENGTINIDIAFLGVPNSDIMGNSNGYTLNGDTNSDCGSLGYAMVDAQYAKKVVILTNNIVDFPNLPAAIPHTQVDYVVKVDAVGDPKKIASGATRYTTDPKELMIAKKATDIMEASGYFVDGYSFQTGTGGAALAVTRFLKDKMLKANITASFALGGITGAIAQLHSEGLIKKLIDVQSFDLGAIESIKNNKNHFCVDASYYASPSNRYATVNMLDIVVLSALEVDINFNINVLTGSDGIIMGAIGGHQDTAAGSKLCIVVAPLIRGRIPTILNRVNTIVTPGDVVDVLVTDAGVAVNPKRADIIKKLAESNIKIKSIQELKEQAEAIVGVPDNVEYGEKIVGYVTYRDGSIIDEIKIVKQ